jgi:hypothetical protein
MVGVIQWQQLRESVGSAVASPAVEERGVPRCISVGVLEKELITIVGKRRQMKFEYMLLPPPARRQQQRVFVRVELSSLLKLYV